MINIIILSVGMLSLDTGIAQHTNDGLLNEWPAERFTEDKETTIQYAIDNDKENLYIALKVTDPFIQTQMMRMGMRTFLDIKAKRKENKGIEFPTNKDFAGRPLTMPPDVKLERMNNALNMLSLKIFGFTDPEPVEQSLEMEGSVKLVFSWDAADVMLIEYSVPLKMIEDDLADLNQKQINLGWKIPALDMQNLTGSQPIQTTTVTTRLVSAPSGRRPSSNPGGNGASRSGNSSQTAMGKMMKDQSVWTKYTFSF